MTKNNEVGLLYGNLLDFPFGINAIAHSCNTLNVMGAGIAKQIADRYPSALEADCYAHHRQENKLGEYSYTFVNVGDGNEYPHQQFGLNQRRCEIYNLYTQKNVGRGKQVSYDALYDAFQKLRTECDGNTVLGLPYGISCGLAGGSWNIVNSMIQDIFLDADFKTYIVKYVN
jgi:O-acetyl-ADP-ribose deacetylase (regulator of RNase III)